jgi:DNA-binding MarR family transcriptional regulator
MDSVELLKVLVKKLEAYEAGTEDKNNLSLKGFIQSVYPVQDIESLRNTFISNSEIVYNEQFVDNNIERIIAQHLLFMYRYIKFYAKQIFNDSVIKTIEEFGFLTTVLQHHTISKSDLIRKNILEKSSGIEIINRLTKTGLIVHRENPDDQRSQLVDLTDDGKSALFKIFEKMNTLGLIAAGDLSGKEKQQLDRFHFENYTKRRPDNLEDYLPKQYT